MLRSKCLLLLFFFFFFPSPVKIIHGGYFIYNESRGEPPKDGITKQEAGARRTYFSSFAVEREYSSRFNGLQQEFLTSNYGLHFALESPRAQRTERVVILARYRCRWLYLMKEYYFLIFLPPFFSGVINGFEMRRCH